MDTHIELEISSINKQRNKTIVNCRICLGYYSIENDVEIFNRRVVENITKTFPEKHSHIKIMQLLENELKIYMRQNKLNLEMIL